MGSAITADQRRLPDPPKQFADAAAHAELTRAVIGGFYAVYNALGDGHLESVYAAALTRELTDRGLRVEREVPVDVRYKGEIVGSFRADILVESCVVLELKALPSVPAAARRQLLNYLRCSMLELGLVLNFGERATVQRVVASNKPPKHLRKSPVESAES